MGVKCLYSLVCDAIMHVMQETNACGAGRHILCLVCFYCDVCAQRQGCVLRCVIMEGQPPMPVCHHVCHTYQYVTERKCHAGDRSMTLWNCI